MKDWIDWTDNTCARIIDSHTVLLGNGANWIQVELPWVARDIVRLLRYACSDDRIDVKEQERVAVIRIVLSKLYNENKKIINEAIKTAFSIAIDPKEHYRKATILREHKNIPFDSPIILVCDPNQLLSYESLIENRQPDAITSVVVLSKESVIAGPALKTRDICPICFRYMASPVFSLHEKDDPDREYMLHAGLAIARVLKRNQNDMIIISNGCVKITPHAPFIGCPKCFPCH